MTDKEILSWAQEFVTQYGQKIADMLGLPLPQITFQIGDGTDAGDTAGTSITLNRGWLEAHPNDVGLLAHELTHAIQGAPINKGTEAIADAVRYKLGMTYEGWTPSSAALRFADLSAKDFATASVEMNRGTFSTIANIGANANIPAPSPAPTGLTPEQVNKDMQPQSNDPGTINSVLGTAETGTTTPTGLTDKQLAKQIAAVLGQQQQQGNPKNFKAGAQMILQSWGIPLTPSLQGLIEKGAKAGWNMTTLQYYLEQTPEFHQAFPGIFDANGTLKMSPTQYMSTLRSYQSYAAQTGIDLNAQQTAYLFRNDVSPAEFAQRAQAVTTLRTNKQYFDAFNQQLKQLGMQPLSRGDQFKFVMGEGNQEWYDIWTQASTRYSAEQAGLKFGNAAKAYTNIGEGVIKKIAGLGLTQPQMQQGFAQLAKDLQTTLPMSRIQKFGLSKQDLVELEFGGPRQAAVAAKVQQIMKNEDAFLKNQVNLAGQTGQLGVSGPRTQQPVAYGP